MFCSEQKELVICMNGLEDHIHTKAMIMINRVLSAVLSDDQFHIMDVGLLGSHSIHKYVVTFAHGNG
jgi:hypothetical protein